MGLFWIALGIYGLLSTVLLWGGLCTFVNADGQTALQTCWQQMAGVRKLMLSIAITVTAPVVLPLLLWRMVKCYVQQRRYWTAELNTHRDFVCERIHAANLPSEIEKAFDQQTPAVTALGFYIASNYIVAREPLLIYGRYFLHEELPVYFAVLHLDDDLAYSLVTLFDDGSVNETCPANHSMDPGEFPVSCPFHVRFADPAAAADEYLQEHLTGVAARCEQTGAKPMLYRPEQLPELMIHEKRVLSGLRQARGEMTSDVPLAILPGGTVVEDVTPWLETTCVR